MTFCLTERRWVVKDWTRDYWHDGSHRRPSSTTTPVPPPPGRNVLANAVATRDIRACKRRTIEVVPCTRLLHVAKEYVDAQRRH